MGRYQAHIFLFVLHIKGVFEMKRMQTKYLF